MTENYLQVFREYSISGLESIADYIRHSNKSITTAQQEFEKKFETIEDGHVVIRFDLESGDEYSKLQSISPHFFRLSSL